MNDQKQTEPVKEEPTSDEEVDQAAEEKPVEAKTEASIEQSQQEADEQTNEPESKQEESIEDSQEGIDESATQTSSRDSTTSDESTSKAKWYVVHTYSGHENKVLANLKQRIESEHLENKILDMLVPTQDKIEIRAGKKEEVKEKIFPGYILVKMVLDDTSWLAVRTTPGVTSFVGIGNKPTPIPETEVKSIVSFMKQGAQPTFKDVFLPDDTVKIIDGPFTEFIGKVDSVDKERGKVRVLVSIFGRETPVELDFLQIQKL